jgi:hypothetical protein
MRLALLLQQVGAQEPEERLGQGVHLHQVQPVAPVVVRLQLQQEVQRMRADLLLFTELRQRLQAVVLLIRMQLELLAHKEESVVLVVLAVRVALAEQLEAREELVAPEESVVKQMQEDSLALRA